MKALGLVETQVDQRLIPNLAGLLVVGRAEVLGRRVPTHDVEFHVLGAENEVIVNEDFRGPVLGVLDDIEKRFAARNAVQEIIVGMVRLPVPDYSAEAFREVINNAMLHRDYGRHEAVYIQWQPDQLSVTSPGGFLPGITLDNLLTHEPKPRNTRLADVFRRVGLVERTGRGIDKIFAGLLRYGRPAPDYGGVIIRRSGSSCLVSEQTCALPVFCTSRRVPTDTSDWIS